MTMNFETIRDAVITVLDDGASGNYVVTHGEKQSRGANEALIAPRVTVFVERFEAEKKSSAARGPFHTTVEMRLEFMVAVKASVDIAALNNPTTTDTEAAAILTAMPDVSSECSKQMDALARNVFQVLMRADNYYLGLEKGVARDRWFGPVEKDAQPMFGARYAILTGQAKFEFKSFEEVSGLVPVACENIDVTVDIENDLGSNAGVSVDIEEA